MLNPAHGSSADPTPVAIPPDRAYWLLRSLKVRSSPLLFAGRIQDTSGIRDAVILEFRPELGAMVLLLFDERTQEYQNRWISLQGASFYLTRLGDSGFPQWAESHYMQIIEMRFPSAGIVRLAELAPCARPSEAFG